MHALRRNASMTTVDTHRLARYTSCDMLPFRYRELAELASPPLDQITRLRCHPANPSLVATASWDKSVKLYNIDSNEMRFSFEHLAAVLDVCFARGAAFAGSGAAEAVVVSGSIDARVRLVDMVSGTSRVVARHDQGVKCVGVCEQRGLISSVSWDRTAMLLDPRQPTVDTSSQSTVSNKPVHLFSLPNTPHASIITENHFLVATAQLHLCLYDIRNPSNPVLDHRNSIFKGQTRCISPMPDGRGYLTGGLEGRVALDWFDPETKNLPVGSYAFKCHRQSVDGVDWVYPVNAVAFHPIHGSFATGGADGAIYIWDAWHKRRLKQLPVLPAGVSSMEFTCDGQRLVVGTSYTFEHGDIGYEMRVLGYHVTKKHSRQTPPPVIYVRNISGLDLRSKKE